MTKVMVTSQWPTYSKCNVSFVVQLFFALFVFERRPRIGFHHLRWKNGRQSCITPTQVTVFQGLLAFLSSHLTTLCCAMLPNR